MSLAEYPPDWIKGQLLNVRNLGDRYAATLLEEEYDYRKPDRAVHFESSFEAQQFVSWWYAPTLRAA